VGGNSWGVRSNRVVQLAVLSILAAAGVLAFGSGSALASGTVFCAPYGAGTAADVQTAADGGGTVFIKGVCSGQLDLTTSVTLQGLTGGATSGINGTGFDGAAITQDSGAYTVTLKNLLVTGGGQNSDDGGGFWNDFRNCSSVTNIVGSHITGNTITGTDAWGAGINGESCTTINVTNTLVNGNAGISDQDNGGGIALDCAQALNLTGSTITGNSAAGEGGGIFSGSDCGTTVSIVGSTISLNTAGSDGGGLYTYGSSLLLQSSSVKNNSAPRDGGGIEFGNASGCCGPVGGSPRRQAKALLSSVPFGLTIMSSSVDHNTVQSGAGGGIYVYTGCGGALPVTIDGSSVSFNQTLGNDLDTDSGGGGYAQFGDCNFDTVGLVATNSSFGGNLASKSVGGGIFNVAYDGTATVSLAQTKVGQTNQTLNPNKAKWGAGIFDFGVGASTALQGGGQIVHNMASVTGGGVYDDCGSSLTLGAGSLLLFNFPNNLFTNPGCLLED